MISSVCNAHLLSDIISIEDPAKVFTIGESQDYHQRGTLKLLDFQVYFNPTSIANILSLSEISDVYRITMDTSALPPITVHINDTDNIVFSKCGSRLYYFDTNIKGNSTNDALVNHY